MMNDYTNIEIVHNVILSILFPYSGFTCKNSQIQIKNIEIQK